MKRRLVFLAMVLLAALAGAGPAAAVEHATVPSTGTAATTGDTTPKLVRFNAFLFNRDTGAFSPDVLAREGKGKPAALGNVVGGAFASDSTFVSVEIRAPAGDIIAAGTRIRFKAIDTDETPYAPGRRRVAHPKVLVDKIVPIRRVKSGASSFVGFWLPSTGCAPVKLSAEWVGVRNVAKLTDTLAFVCHE